MGGAQAESYDFSHVYTNKSSLCPHTSRGTTQLFLDELFVPTVSLQPRYLWMSQAPGVCRESEGLALKLRPFRCAPCLHTFTLSCTVVPRLRPAEMTSLNGEISDIEMWCKKSYKGLGTA